MPSLDTAEARLRVVSAFPSLDTAGTYEIRSRVDKTYNCIAFAVGDQSCWWWPGEIAGDHWPVDIDRLATQQAFTDMFALLGYQETFLKGYEANYDRVALYAKNGEPKHASRQERTTGYWLSKLGKSYDIMHTELDGLKGDRYGEVVTVYRRPHDYEPARSVKAMKFTRSGLLRPAVLRPDAVSTS